MAVPVLHVCDKFGVAGSSIHGVSRLFSWWLPRFDPTRFDVRLVGLKAPEPASRLLMEAGIPVHHLGRGKFDPRVATDLIALVRGRGTRILHVHGYAAADFGRIAARITGAALVLHEHFADPRMPAYQGVADRLLAPFIDRAIAVSGSTRDFLVRERHVPAAKVALIWNGAPLDEFAPVSAEAARVVRNGLGIPADAIVIGTVGRLSEQKAHHVLLDAAARVLPERPKAWVLIAGDGDRMPSLQAQAVRLGISTRVVFAGHRADVPAVLGAIDVFCISSDYEGTPLALFEAMAAHKAIVSTAVDGCREVLDGETAGLLVPPRDPEALGLALARVVDDAALRARLSRMAGEASRRYDIGECVRQMEALYDDVLRGGAPRSR
jgi:glycosyltransferase involved in cell wall biosynthesis